MNDRTALLLLVLAAPCFAQDNRIRLDEPAGKGKNDVPPKTAAPEVRPKRDDEDRERRRREERDYVRDRVREQVEASRGGPRGPEPYRPAEPEPDSARVWVAIDVVFAVEGGQDEDSPEPEFFARVRIGDRAFETRHWRHVRRLCPDWVFEADVQGRSTVPIRIEILDVDDAANETYDVNPARDERVLDLTYDVEAGVVSGDARGSIGRTIATTGDGEPAARLEFRVGHTSTWSKVQICVEPIELLDPPAALGGDVEYQVRATWRVTDPRGAEVQRSVVGERASVFLVDLPRNHRELAAMIEIFARPRAGGAWTLCDASSDAGEPRLRVQMQWTPEGRFLRGPVRGGPFGRNAGQGEAPAVSFFFAMQYFSSPGEAWERPDRVAHPSTREYDGQSPRDLDWYDDMQGVANDASNWYFTNDDNLWKVPVGTSLANCQEGRDGGFLRARIPAGHQHFGDPDHHEGKVYVPIWINGGDGAVAVYEASTLRLLGITDPLPLRTGWVAVNRGYLYTSGHVDEDHPILIYRIDLSDPRRPRLESHASMTLLGHDGQPMSLRHMQGGCFSPDGAFLFTVNGYYDDRYQPDGLHAFEVNGRTARLAHHSTHEYGSFRFQFETGLTAEEPEGITYWDLSDGRAPGVTGRLHVILLDNDASDDEWTLKHYR